MDGVWLSVICLNTALVIHCLFFFLPLTVTLSGNWNSLHLRFFAVSRQNKCIGFHLEELFGKYMGKKCLHNYYCIRFLLFFFLKDMYWFKCIQLDCSLLSCVLTAYHTWQNGIRYLHMRAQRKCQSETYAIKCFNIYFSPLNSCHGYMKLWPRPMEEVGGAQSLECFSWSFKI